MDLAPLVAAIRAAAPEPVAIYLFGSAARGDCTAKSDVDLAVLPRRPLGGVERFELQERLAGILGRDVDLVDLRTASTVMVAQILGDGRLLFEGDRTARALFEAIALADYTRLNEERRHILDDVRRLGRIHG